MIDLVHSEKSNILGLKANKAFDVVLISGAKKSARAVNDSFEACGLTNKLLHKTSIADLNKRNMRQSIPQLVLVDADTFPDTWCEIVHTAKEIGSVTGVIVLSTFGDLDILIKARNCGADEFIVKPFDIIGMLQIRKKLPEYKITMVMEEYGE